MKQSIKFLLAAVAAMFVSVASFAQVTTSALNGRVTDASGAAVIGAAVVATHAESGTVYGAVTNNDGRYIISGMRAGGPYNVEISCLGYQSLTYTDVTLQLAETYSLNAKLSDDSQMLTEAMVISEAASKFSTEKMGSATNISNKEITELPTVSRSISDITRLSPYGGNGMSFAGADGRTANFTVDGANFNNNFGLSSSLPGGDNPISIDAIEELHVVISPYDVRQNNFIGGGVNAITKSGTNTFKGSAYVYHNNEYMHGDSIEREQISGARDKSRNTRYGLTFGGPIVKNKLFFFVNFEYASAPTIASRWRGSEEGVADANNYISRTKLDDLKTVSTYVKNKYGYDTGSWTSFPADESNMKILARIDWNINQKNHLAIRYNYTENNSWTAPNASSMDGGTRYANGRMSKASMSFANSMYSMRNIVHTVSVDLNSRISDHLSNQFLATYSKLDDVRGSNSEDFPFIDIAKGGDNYMALGYELFTWNNAVHNTVANIKDEIYYYTGNHKITAGLSYEYQMADNAYMRNGTGYYRYNSLADFLDEKTPEVVALTYGYDGEANPAARVQFHKAGIYAQEEWTPSNKFKLTAGLRLDGLFFSNKDLMTNNAIKDLAYYPKSHGYTEQHIDTGKWPNAQISISPRIGFNWDILGDKSLTLRGGTGLFSGRLPLVFFTNMPTNGGMVQYKAVLSTTQNNPATGKKFTDAEMDVFSGGILKRDALHDKLIKDMGFPNTVSPEDGTIPSAVAAVDPKFKMPQVWKTSLAIDYAFPTSFPFTISAEGIYNKTVNGVTICDWSVMPVEGFARLNGADNRPIYPSNFRKAVNSQGVNKGTKAFVLTNTNKGYGYSATVTLNMCPIKELSIMAAYTHTASKELTGMPGSDAESAFTYVPTTHGPNNIKLHNSQYVTPNRVVASLTYNNKCGDHFSLIYETWQGGYNYSYMMANDMNGDGYQYDAMYIPTDKQVYDGEFRFTDDLNRDMFMDFVHKDKYLSNHQGQYAEGYSVYSPWVHRFDFAYKHDFKVRIGNSINKLQLSIDLKNVGNLFCDRWGVSKQMNPDLNSGRILKYEGADGQGYATFSTPLATKDEKTGETMWNASRPVWTRVHALGQCWYASIGIKYMFN